MPMVAIFRGFSILHTHTFTCVDANHVIDGRRANSNLTSLGAQRSKTYVVNTKNQNNNGAMRNMRVIGGFHYHIQAGGVFNQSAGNGFPQYSAQQEIPSYNFLYGELWTVDLISLTVIKGLLDLTRKVSNLTLNYIINTSMEVMVLPT